MKETQEEITKQAIQDIIDSHWQTFANFVNTSAAAEEIYNLHILPLQKKIDDMEDIKLHGFNF